MMADGRNLEGEPKLSGGQKTCAWLRLSRGQQDPQIGGQPKSHVAATRTTPRARKRDCPLVVGCGLVVVACRPAAEPLVPVQSTPQRLGLVRAAIAFQECRGRVGRGQLGGRANPASRHRRPSRGDGPRLGGPVPVACTPQGSRAPAAGANVLLWGNDAVARNPWAPNLPVRQYHLMQLTNCTNLATRDSMQPGLSAR